MLNAWVIHFHCFIPFLESALYLELAWHQYRFKVPKRGSPDNAQLLVSFGSSKMISL